MSRRIDRIDRIRRVNAKRPRELEVSAEPSGQDRTDVALEIIRALLDDVPPRAQG